MREIAEYTEEGYQVVFVAPLAGIYRFIAVNTTTLDPAFTMSGSSVRLIFDQNGQVGSMHMFMAPMAQDAELRHTQGACVLTGGAREPDEVPPEE